jgi:hypothetical protein
MKPEMIMIDCLLTVLRPAQEYFTYMETSSLGLWAGRDLYRATPAVTLDLSFSGLIRRTAPFSRLLRHTRGSGGPILTRILTGPPLSRLLQHTSGCGGPILTRILTGLGLGLSIDTQKAYHDISIFCIVSWYVSMCITFLSSSLTEWFKLYNMYTSENIWREYSLKLHE